MISFSFRDHIQALRERERKHRHALTMAKRNREQASKLLKETMTKYMSRKNLRNNSIKDVLHAIIEL